eukprot:6199036-Pleurochrysis_carterae.AAC.1
MTSLIPANQGPPTIKYAEPPATANTNFRPTRNHNKQCLKGRVPATSRFVLVALLVRLAQHVLK